MRICSAANGSTKLDSGRGWNALPSTSACWTVVGCELVLGELPGDGEKSLRSVADRIGLRSGGIENPLGDGDLFSQRSIMGLPKSLGRETGGGELVCDGDLGAGLCRRLR